MAEAKVPALVKLIVGTILSDADVLIKAKKILEKKFGPLDFEGPMIPFNFTDYYAAEMGPNLLRQFFSFQRLIQPQGLAGIKLYTNRLERALSRIKTRREINLDPGYLCAAKLILASCKDFSHRIYLEKGVYAELTLQFQDGNFRPLAWTFPDYRTAAYLKCFQAIRQLYMKQV